MISGRFYTSQEIQKILGVSKQRVSDLARQNDWEAHRVGVLYHADDVSQYLWGRWRRDLARQMGITINGLVAHDDWDILEGCPECGSFAIWKPASIEEIQDLDLPVYDDGWPWACIKGHSSSSGRKDNKMSATQKLNISNMVPAKNQSCPSCGGQNIYYTSDTHWDETWYEFVCGDCDANSITTGDFTRPPIEKGRKK